MNSCVTYVLSLVVRPFTFAKAGNFNAKNIEHDQVTCVLDKHPDTQDNKPFNFKYTFYI